LGELLTAFYGYLTFICEEIKKNKKIKKQYFFIFLLQPGIEPTTNKKMEKAAVSRCAFPRPPRSGASPGLRRLSRGRGKIYIFKVQSIFIAKNFLIKEPLCIKALFCF
jgi:hypothetical protein